MNNVPVPNHHTMLACKCKLWSVTHSSCFEQSLTTGQDAECIPKLIWTWWRR